MTENRSDHVYDKIFVARQPIFTQDMQIWGYELLFRHGENAQAALITDNDQATTQVIADGFTLASQGLRKRAKALINFPRNVLVGSAPYVLPPERCVVEILETVEPSAEVLDACLELKRKGYVLALDDFVGEPGFEPLCELADIIKVDILHRKPTEVMDIVKGLDRYKAVLLAEKVESRDMFKVCQRLGFAYFQGFFFSRPEIIPGRKLSSSQTTKLRILKELSEEESTQNRLVEIIQADLAISYKLLQYINSARFSLCCGITSIQRAVALLGRQNLQQWLRVIILSDINSTDKGQELVGMSARRGRFLQLLSAHHPTPFGPEGMFLLGFFSLLDAILDQAMDAILGTVSLDSGIKCALTDRQDPNARWIRLLEELERGDWAGLEMQATVMGLPMTLVHITALEASRWAAEVMSSVG